MTNRLSKFRAKSKEVILKGDQVKMVIKGLTFPELSDFAELIEDKKTKQALNLLLFVTLRKAVPTKEENPAEGMNDQEINAEIKQMDSGTALEIINIVKEVSNLPRAPDEEKKN